MSRTLTGAKMQRTALLIVMIFLISDLSSFSAGANSYDTDSDVEKSTHASPIMVEGLPPLMCGEGLCERPLRTDLRTSQPASEEMDWVTGHGMEGNIKQSERRRTYKQDISVRKKYDIVNRIKHPWLT